MKPVILCFQIILLLLLQKLQGIFFLFLFSLLILNSEYFWQVGVQFFTTVVKNLSK